jgi:hypothetical protein
VKGIQAFVFAMLFITLALVLETVTPTQPCELYELYMSYVQNLWAVVLFSLAMSGALLIVSIVLKIEALNVVFNIY